MDAKQRKDGEKKAPKSKREYRTPTVSVYGTMRELTAGGPSGYTETGGAPGTKFKPGG